MLIHDGCFKGKESGLEIYRGRWAMELSATSVSLWKSEGEGRLVLPWKMWGQSRPWWLPVSQKGRGVFKLSKCFWAHKAQVKFHITATQIFLSTPNCKGKSCKTRQFFGVLLETPWSWCFPQPLLVDSSIIRESSERGKNQQVLQTKRDFLSQIGSISWLVIPALQGATSC